MAAPTAGLHLSDALLAATLTIPVLTTARTDGAYALHLTLCSHDLHEPAPEMTVVIRSTSRLVLNARHSLLTVEN